MSISFPEEVTIVEMLPRDGFQRFPRWVPTEEKIAIIDDLSRVGLPEIEVTSFTHPDVVPNLRDAEAVVSGITRRSDVVYRALVPNVIGTNRAIDAGIDKVNALITASPEYNRRNQNMTIDENLVVISEIIDIGHDSGLTVEAGIGMSFFSPYEGRIAKSQTLRIVEEVIGFGVDEVTLATSMGMANPVQVADVVSTIYRRFPDVDLGLHLHDTNGMSLANTIVAMQLGIRRFDCSIGGLGGGVILPDAMENIGNTPTEDLLNMLREMNVESGVDFEAIVTIARDTLTALDVPASSHVLMGGIPEVVLAQNR